MLSTKMPLNVKECPVYRDFRATGLSNIDYIDKHATMACVVPRRSNVELSLSKCNIKPKRPVDALQKYADGIAERYLAPYLSTTTVSVDDAVTFNFSTSPSKSWKLRGCKNKGEALNHPEFANRVGSIDHVPIMDYNGKVELLDKEDIIIQNKIRGTFNPPIDFLAKQKILFDRQNANLIANRDKIWIKYGFVKQFGGFNRLGKMIEELYDFIDEDDAVGWDRAIWLVWVYEMRTKYLKIADCLLLMLLYVTYFTLNCYVMCPDGVVRIRKTGNFSGSNNTTTDNSMAHMPIVIRFICKLWLFGKNRLPTYDEVFENHMYAIYSDDALGAHKLESLGISDEDFVRIKTETYLEFGLALKPKQHYHSYMKGRIDPNHSFLGSSFHYDESLGVYVPYPRVDKLASSLKYFVTPHNDLEMVAKVVSLLILSCAAPELHTECTNFLDFLLARYPDIQEVPLDWRSYAALARDNPSVWAALLSGREA